MDGLRTKLHVPRERLLPKRCAVNPTGLPGSAPVFSHSSTVGNMSWAVQERVMGRFVDGVWEPTIKPVEFATPSMRAIRRRVCALVPEVSPITHNEYCEKYAGLRRKAYENARDSLLVRSLERRDADLNVFLKAEKWTEPKAPRVISPRDPRFLISMGCYISPLEHVLYKAFRRMEGAPVIMKGLDQQARAAVAVSHWNSFVSPVAVGLDASKFDQHTSRQALQFEHGFYLKPYHNDKFLQTLCNMQLENRCYATLDDGKCSWVSDGGRMSGDTNTALGNCLLSATMLKAWAKEKGVKVRMMVDGDDCVVFMEKECLSSFMNGLTTWYLERGYPMKVEGPYYKITEIEFCQSKLMIWAGNSLFVRNPYKAVNQDHTWIIRGGIEHEDVLTATGLGGLSIYGDIPVLGAYYRMLAGRKGLSAKVARRLDFRSSWLRWTVDGNKTYSRPTDDARVAFFETFGMHPCDQVDLENEYLRRRVTTARHFDINHINTISAVELQYIPSILTFPPKHGY